MSEVFLAEDARLNRKVALKLLPADFAADRKRCIALFESLNKEFRYKKRARRLIQNQSSRETRPRQIQNGREMKQ